MSKRRGRPPTMNGEGAAGVFVKMPADLYDFAYAEARARAITVPEFLRRLVRIKKYKIAPADSLPHTEA